MYIKDDYLTFVMLSLDLSVHTVQTKASARKIQELNVLLLPALSF
jgi:hypothetical protein